MDDRTILAHMMKDMGLTDDVQAVGYLMRDWLQNMVSDNGNGVDCGGGMGSFDLWVTVGGKELFITITEKAAAIGKKMP